jgi:hypothetical protein
MKWVDPGAYYLTNNEKTAPVMKYADPALYQVFHEKKKEEPKPVPVAPKEPEPIVTTTTAGSGAFNDRSNFAPQPTQQYSSGVPYGMGGGQYSSGVPYGMNNPQQSQSAQRSAAANLANQQITGSNQFTMPNTNGLTFGGGY